MPIPATWPELLASEEGLQHHRSNLELFPTASADFKRYLVAAEAAPAVALLDNPRAVAEAVRAAAPGVPAALKRMVSLGGSGAVLRAIYFLDFLNAAECCGAEGYSLAMVPVDETVAMFVESADSLDREDRFHAGFVLLGLERFAEMEKIALGAAPRRFAPGKTFGYNVQGFLGYISSALQSHASAPDVEPAFAAFVETIPRALHDKKSTWADLMWAARAFFHQIGGKPVGEVATLLHSFVRKLP